MPWARVDDGFWSHPKAIVAGAEAIGVWARALSWSAQQLTDGWIPDEMIPLLAHDAPGAPDRLSTAGLWEISEGGFRIHDYLDYNPSRSEVLAKREAERERKARQRGGPSPSRPGGTSSGRDPDVIDPVPNPTQPNPDPTLPDPTRPSDAVVRRWGQELRGGRWPAPTVESELRGLVEKHGAERTLQELEEFFRNGGRRLDSFARRLSEGWGNGSTKPQASASRPECGVDGTPCPPGVGGHLAGCYYAEASS
jgi:hypothetical protein